MSGTVGKYTLKSRLGTGASSVVYLAVVTFTQGEVALKVIA